MTNSPDIPAQAKERRKRLLRLLEDSPGSKAEDFAEELGVSERTLRRDVVAMKAAGNILVPVAPTPAERRELAVVEHTLDTYAVVRRTLAGLQNNLTQLEQEMGFAGEKCECCGRKPIKENPLHWQNLTKFYDSITNAAKLQAQMLGQLDNTVVVIHQADRDVMVIIESLANLETLVEEAGVTVNDDGTVDVSKVTLRLAQEIYQKLWGSNSARVRRTPGFSGIVEGTFHEVRESADDES